MPSLFASQGTMPPLHATPSQSAASVSALARRGSFWTNRQRQGHSLNEISYRACFKPQLPQYFIDRFSQEGDIVLDPFMGRGTTAIQAAMSRRIAYGSDINPLSKILTAPRLAPPPLKAVAQRFHAIPNDNEITSRDEGLLAFYHPDTLRHLLSLKQWFLEREAANDMTAEDDWLRMIVVNRLSGHSGGFLSVRTMPPNQAVSIERQRKINRTHGRTPEKKDILAVILKKSRSLLRDRIAQSFLAHAGRHKLRCCNARRLNYIEAGEVTLAVTSPPFLNVVDYGKDNWLRCWFVGIDADSLKFDDVHARIESWEEFVAESFAELARVVKPGGHVAFEVGEVKHGRLRLENNVVSAIAHLPFVVEEILINEQSFTKTSNCWGVKNNAGGTNTNRIIVARRT